MARRRSRTRTRTRTVTRRVGSRARRGLGSVTSILKPMAQGIGGGAIGETVANAAGQPNLAQIGGYGGAYLFGGVKGVLGKVAFDVLSGRGLGFGNILGGSKPVEVSV